MREAFGFDIDTEREFWGLDSSACADPISARRWSVFVAIYSLKINAPRSGREEAIELLWDRRKNLPNLLTREELSIAVDRVWERLGDLARLAREADEPSEDPRRAISAEASDSAKTHPSLQSEFSQAIAGANDGIKQEALLDVLASSSTR